LSHASSSFCSGYFGYRVLFFAQAGLNHDSPILHLLSKLGWGLKRFFFFCLDCPGTAILPIPIGMTGVCHCTQKVIEVGS
jgi:hypothetical protein